MLETTRILGYLALTLTAGMLSACGGAGAIGDSCDVEAEAGQCADGAYCAKDTDATLQCMKVCSAQSDCPADTTCTGTKGSTQVCQPNP
ncbi:MAG: hypothetical protein QM820_56495 [Minicystis sp.]